MNIVIANGQELNPLLGGIERDSTILAEKFVSLGHNVYFLVGKVSPYSKEYIPAAEQTFLPNGKKYLCNENILFFTEYALKRNVDVIINQAGDILEFSLLCSEVVKCNNAKLVSVVHFDPVAPINRLSDFSNSILKVRSLLRRILKRFIYPYRYYKTKKAMRFHYRQLYSISTKVVLVSQYFLSPFLKLIDLPDNNKVTAILNPSRNVQKSLDIKRKSQILYVGRIKYSQKRTDRMIEIWEKLFRYFPDWELVVIGDGPLLNYLKDYVSANNIQRVSFKGIDNPEIHYQESEILCLTSSSEGLGMVLIEAIKLGCIPIAFDSFPSVHEIIRNNVNGILIKKFKINSYVQVLKKLMLNPELRKELRNDESSVYRKFDPDTIAKQWINLFDQMNENDNLSR